ncbi:putative glucan endo-1,3-beta-glucosidase eglC [Cladobotryum mycophilum]|uniref:Glucan endo-1,3-beta-glucosidase eglC n=1 Tax=Cladobotryum mycophilum TaxID=491253 RepID=A0ABR0S7Q7_9HYPO
MHFSTLAAGAALVASAAAAGQNYLGFNSGATLPDRSAKFKADFAAEFKTAQGLVGAPGTFNAVRLYTNIQAYSQDDPIQAFEAAIDTKTFMLLGIWASGTDNIDKELSALTKAVKQYGTKFTDLVIGISIGSEDLYRDSETGRKNKGGVGAGPQQVLEFIKKYKSTVASTTLNKVPVGHVDTWDAWVNGTNKAVLDEVDWLGVDEYPFYESGKGNDIKNAGTLFDRAYDATLGVANGKPVWVTETGWPYIGPSWDQAVPSVKNAQKYWQEVGCRRLFNKTPTFWYNLRDSNPDNEVKFAVSKDLSTTPAFDLKCPTKFDTPDHTTTSGSTTATTSGASTATHSTLVPTHSGSGSGSGSTSGVASPTGGAPATVTTGAGTNAGAVNKLSGAAYAGVALVAGFLALL